MLKNLNTIEKWELWGIVWIITVGSLLHFTFEWSSNSKFVALFSPVNESVWEHLKLGYFALLFFIFIEYLFLKNHTTSFFIGKFIGILILTFTILIVFYSYHAIVGEESLIVNIFSFVLGAILCQIVSMKILKINFNKITNITSLVGFVILGIILIFFTFFPPELPIFMDNNTGKYGIDS